MVGAGEIVGSELGLEEGTDDGVMVGSSEGAPVVGDDDGCWVVVGCWLAEGLLLGCSVGVPDGDGLGTSHCTKMVSSSDSTQWQW